MMNYEKDFRSFLTCKGLNLEEILKRHSLEKQDDISRRRTFGLEKDRYKAVKDEIQAIVLEAFLVYIDRYGAILKQEAAEWLHHELENQQQMPLRDSTFCSALITTQFNRLAEEREIYKATKWRTKHGGKEEYQVKKDSSDPYSNSTVYFRDEERITEYAFQRFGKELIEDGSDHAPDKSQKPDIGQEAKGPEKTIQIRPDTSTELMGIKDAELYLSGKGILPEDAKAILMDKILGQERLIFVGLEKRPAHFYQNQLDRVAEMYNMSEN